MWLLYFVFMTSLCFVIALWRWQKFNLWNQILHTFATKTSSKTKSILFVWLVSKHNFVFMSLSDSSIYRKVYFLKICINFYCLYQNNQILMNEIESPREIMGENLYFVNLASSSSKTVVMLQHILLAHCQGMTQTSVQSIVPSIHL